MNLHNFDKSVSIMEEKCELLDESDLRQCIDDGIKKTYAKFPEVDIFGHFVTCYCQLVACCRRKIIVRPYLSERFYASNNISKILSNIFNEYIKKYAKGMTDKEIFKRFNHWCALFNDKDEMYSLKYVVENTFNNKIKAVKALVFVLGPNQYMFLKKVD